MPYKYILQDPVYNTKSWEGRDPFSKIKRIIIHCTDTNLGSGQSELAHIDAIHNYSTSPGNHVSSHGLPSIPYHWVVGEKSCYYTVRESNITWHARGINTSSIGVALIYRATGAKSPPSNKMFDNLTDLLVELCSFYDLIKDEFLDGIILGHREVPNYLQLIGRGSYKGYKECPGKLINLDEVRDIVYHKYLYRGEYGR